MAQDITHQNRISVNNFEFSPTALCSYSVKPLGSMRILRWNIFITGVFRSCFGLAAVLLLTKETGLSEQKFVFASGQKCHTYQINVHKESLSPAPVSHLQNYLPPKENKVYKVHPFCSLKKLLQGAQPPGFDKYYLNSVLNLSLGWMSIELAIY